LNNAAERYRTSQFTTSSPGELTLQLYNGALRFIKQAKEALSQRQLDKAHEYNLRVQDIISELMITLNLDVPISGQFLVMYDYMKRRMIEANVSKDEEILKEVEDLFVQFRDTWKEVIIISRQQA